MESFVKPKKKKKKKETRVKTTLNQKHINKLEEFKRTKKNMDDSKKDLQKLKKDLQKLSMLNELSDQKKKKK